MLRMPKLAVHKVGNVIGLHVDTIANLGGYGSLLQQLHQRIYMHL